MQSAELIKRSRKKGIKDMELIIYLCFLFAVIGVVDMFYIMYKDIRKKINASCEAKKRRMFKAAVNKVMRDFRAREERTELMENVLAWNRELQEMRGAEI